MKKYISLIILAGMFISLMSCKKEDNGDDNGGDNGDEPNGEVYMGTAFTGQSIPVETTYSYDGGDYYSEVTFKNNSRYQWNHTMRTDSGDFEFSEIVTCKYDPVSGAFSDTLEVTHDEKTMGIGHYFPVSFCINELKKLYLFTFDVQRDTAIIFPRIIAEKVSGSAGTIKGSYKASCAGHNWYAIPDGLAQFRMDAQLDYTYGENTFSGTSTVRLLMESNIEMPGQEVGSLDTTFTTSFNGTWEFDEITNTIQETMTSPDNRKFTYTPYWVSYNDKLYLVTSLSRFYQKE